MYKIENNNPAFETIVEAINYARTILGLRNFTVERHYKSPYSKYSEITARFFL